MMAVMQYKALLKICSVDLFRIVAAETCAVFDTVETQGEYEARKRAEERRTVRPAQEGSTTGPGQAARGAQTSGRRRRTFNLKTVKLHFLGDYVQCIKKNGTTDSYTSQLVLPTRAD